MKKLKSEFSILQVIVTPIVLVLVNCFLCSIIIFVSIESTNDGTPLYKTPIWTVLLFIVLLFYTLRYYSKTFKLYTFLDKGFEVRTVFGKEFHSWKTVKNISVIENNYEKILLQYLIEDSLSINLINGKTLELFSKYYGNMPEIRKYFNSKNDLEVINSYNNNRSITSLNGTTFKGSFIFSFNGILALFLISLSSLMLISKWSSMTLIGLFFLIGIPILLLLVFGIQAYYFQLNQKYLIIRNHIFIHVNHQINLEKVRVIYFEQKFKKESSIRIINHDFSMASFQSNTMKNKHWKSLIMKLRNQDINIIDELFNEFED